MRFEQLSLDCHKCWAEADKLQPFLDSVTSLATSPSLCRASQLGADIELTCGSVVLGL